MKEKEEEENVATKRWFYIYIEGVTIRIKRCYLEWNTDLNQVF